MTGPEWPFRGREAEVAKLNRYLDARAFRAIRVGGRRRVGKSALITEVFRHRKAGPGPVTMAMSDRGINTAGDAVRILIEKAEAAGFPVEDRLKGDLPVSLRFADLLISLISRGAAVAFDEFHYARELGLAGPVREAIDCFATNLGDTEPRGKLIVLGSHQQRMFEMLRDDQPLFNRFRSTVVLHQWSLKTVLRMAADQGFLRFPGRFLSMHTAVGGMPGTWQDFTLQDSAGADIAAWASDEAWRPAFIEGREQALQDQPADRWNNAAFVELSPENLSVFRLIADRKGGCAAAEIRGELKISESRIESSLETLELYLQLVERSGPLLGGAPRWRVCDNPALFQMRVLGRGAAKSDLDTAGPAARAARLAVLEGQALERMAAAWLKETQGVVWSKSGAWMPRLADIDAAAERGFSGAGALILAGCKRSPEKHDPGKLARQFEEFTAGLGDGKEAARLRALPRRLLLISPHFTPEARTRFAGSGFECIDIRDMARSFGINPGPEPGQAAAVPPAGPPDREILRARREIALARKAAAEHGAQRARLEQAGKTSLAEKAEAEAALADTGWLWIQRRREIRERIGRAEAAAGDARRRLTGLKPPTRPRAEDAALAERMTEEERRRSYAEEKTEAMREAGTFLPRQRDPARAAAHDHAPERSLIFVVAKAEHCPPADTLARRWHGFAVWTPGPDVSALLALRDAFPDCGLTPAGEAAALWPAAAPEADFTRAEEDCRRWSVTDHINRIEGRVPDAEPEAAPPRRRPDREGPDPGM